MHIHSPGLTLIIGAPDRLHDRFAGEDPLGIEHEIAKQFKFFVGELDLVFPGEDNMTFQIHTDIAGLEQLYPFIGGPPQQSPHAGERDRAALEVAEDLIRLLNPD